MRKIRLGPLVAFAVLGITHTAAARVDMQTDEHTAEPMPAVAPSTPAPAAEATAPAEDIPKTMTVVLPKHRFELSPRLGVIAGGEVTPSGLRRGYSQASWIGAVDFDAITSNPFFTLGAYAQVSNMGYERVLDGETTSTDGSMTIFSIGPSVKARFQLTPKLCAKAGIYLGYNRIAVSVTEDDKTVDASANGLNVAFNGQLAYEITPTVSLAAQLAFVSQVAGSVTVHGTDYDLAMTPKVFLSFGPEFRF